MEPDDVLASVRMPLSVPAQYVVCSASTEMLAHVDGTPAMVWVDPVTVIPAMCSSASPAKPFSEVSTSLGSTRPDREARGLTPDSEMQVTGAEDVDDYESPDPSDPFEQNRVVVPLLMIADPSPVPK